MEGFLDEILSRGADVQRTKGPRARLRKKSLRNIKQNVHPIPPTNAVQDAPEDHHPRSENWLSKVVHKHEGHGVRQISSPSPAGIPEMIEQPEELDIYRYDMKSMLSTTEIVHGRNRSRNGPIKANCVQSPQQPRRLAKVPSEPDLSIAHVDTGLAKTGGGQTMETTGAFPLPPLEFGIRRTDLRMRTPVSAQQTPGSPGERSMSLSAGWRSPVSVQIPNPPRSDAVFQSDEQAELKPAHPPLGCMQEQYEKHSCTAYDSSLEERYRSSSYASSCYSRESQLSDDDDKVGDVINTRYPKAAGRDLYPVMNPFESQSSVEDPIELAFLDMEASPPADSTLESLEQGLPQVLSEPGSRILLMAEEDVSIDRPGSISSQIWRNSAEPTIDQAQRQLEEKLQAMVIGTQQRQDSSMHSRSDSNTSTLRSRKNSPTSSLCSPFTEYGSPPASPLGKHKPRTPSNSSCLLHDADADADCKEQNVEADDVKIEASVASKIVYLILAGLPDLSSLFSAAQISKGFYQVYKENKLGLIKLTIAKISPTVVKLCDLSCSEGRLSIADEKVSARKSRSPAIAYLKEYDHVMYTVVSLKSLITERCRGLLKGETIRHLLSEAGEERADRVDTAFFRIWMFCLTFGCNSGRINDITAQKEWFGNLKRWELEDVLDVWKALQALLHSFEIKVGDAVAAGVLGAALPEDAQAQKAGLRQWLCHMMTLGPSVLAELASTYPSTSFAIMKKAQAKGWTQWQIQLDGRSLSAFLIEAATCLHVERVLAETRHNGAIVPVQTPNHDLRNLDQSRSHHQRAATHTLNTASRWEGSSACLEAYPSPCYSLAHTKSMHLTSPSKSAEEALPALPPPHTMPMLSTSNKRKPIRSSKSCAALVPPPSSPSSKAQHGHSYSDAKEARKPSYSPFREFSKHLYWKTKTVM